VEVYRLLDEANAQCSRGTLEGAIESLGAYERAFSASDERPDAQLYCLYRTAWVAANFVSMNYEREESHARALAASEKALSLALRREGRAYECLRAFSEPYGAIAGPLIHRETVRFCGHYVARDYLSTSSGPDDVRLEEALEFIERAVAYIDENNHYATMLPFTQVRVLMKMGRMKEAFRITRDLDLSHPDCPHLKDIKAGEAYTSWLASEG
jgi:hypothetical protein